MGIRANTFSLLAASALVSLSLSGCSDPKGGPGTDADDTGVTEPDLDQDNDGYESDVDCDDFAADVYPGAEEVCDGADNDCDGEVDGAAAVGAVSLFVDLDGDGAGDPDTIVVSCPGEVGLVENGDDCDDTEANAFLGNPEVCGDSIDNDCDGVVDQIDADADGFVDLECGGLDCDDTDDGINPDATEICDDGVDQNCDGGSGACSWLGDVSNGGADVAFRGESEGDRLGQGDPGATSAGDLNGDGIGDLVMAAIRDDDGGDNAGAAYVFHGPISAGDWSAADGESKITGEATNDLLGRSVAGLGDMDGDGFGELAVSAQGNGASAGAVYVLSGPLDGAISAAAATAKLTGEAEGDLVADIAWVGDADNDGLNDLLVAAQFNGHAGVKAGAVYLVTGAVSGTQSLSTATARLTGAAAGDEAGSAIAGAGDLDGDGLGDVLAGAQYHDGNGEDAGAVHVLLAPLAGDIDLGGSVSTIHGEAAGDGLGSFASVAGAGDVNDDGHLDIVVGSRANGTSDVATGAAYVFFGPIAAGGQTADQANVILRGELTQDYAGDSVAGPGDVDGDGTDDLLIGSGYSDAAYTNGGAAYLVLGGPLSGTLSLSAANARFTAESPEDRVRTSAAGDVNGDGLSDILTAAQLNDTAGNQSGSVYLFFGQGL
jgi:hypothetical protein